MVNHMAFRQRTHPGRGERLFVQACVLSGCDYAPSLLSGVGLVTAFKLVRDNSDVSPEKVYRRALSGLSKKAKIGVQSEDYNNLLLKSESVFYYHPVKDVDGNIVPLMDPRGPGSGTGYFPALEALGDLSFLGDDACIRELARSMGNLKAKGTGFPNSPIEVENELGDSSCDQESPPQRAGKLTMLTQQSKSRCEAKREMDSDISDLINLYGENKTTAPVHNYGYAARKGPPLSTIDANRQMPSQKQLRPTNPFAHFSACNNGRDVRCVKREFGGRRASQSRLITVSRSLNTSASQTMKVPASHRQNSESTLELPSNLDEIEQSQPSGQLSDDESLPEIDAPIEPKGSSLHILSQESSDLDSISECAVAGVSAFLVSRSRMDDSSTSLGQEFERNDVEEDCAVNSVPVQKIQKREHSWPAQGEIRGSHDRTASARASQGENAGRHNHHNPYSKGHRHATNKGLNKSMNGPPRKTGAAKTQNGTISKFFSKKQQESVRRVTLEDMRQPSNNANHEDAHVVTEVDHVNAVENPPAFDYGSAKKSKRNDAFDAWGSSDELESPSSDRACKPQAARKFAPYRNPSKRPAKKAPGELERAFKRQCEANSRGASGSLEAALQKIPLKRPVPKVLRRSNQSTLDRFTGYGSLVICVDEKDDDF